LGSVRSHRGNQPHLVGPLGGRGRIEGSAVPSIIDSASTAQGNDNPLLAAVAGEAFSLYDRSLAEASAVSLVLVGFVMSWALFVLPWLDED
jgi:hypothetical protein